MKKINLVLLIIVIVLILLIAGWGVWKLTSGSQFSAVYLTTGDLYFGKLVRFPVYGMKQVYTLQVNTQDQENPLSVQKFENVFWGPGDFLRINRDQVIWATPLNEIGQMSQLLTQNPDLLPTQQPMQGNQMPTQGTEIPGMESNQ